MKLLYQVNEQRFIAEMEYNAKHKSKGVLNWYESLENGEIIVNVFYDIYGVTYYFKGIKSKLSAVMNLYLQDVRFKIMFPVNAEELFPKEQKINLNNISVI